MKGVVMRNKVQLVVIAVLMVLSAYLMITDKNAIDFLKKENRLLNAQLVQKDEACETRIALLKASSASEKEKTMAAADRPVPNLLAKLPVNQAQKRRETIEEMSGVLKLTDGQKEEIKAILVDFRRQKMEVLGRLSGGKISIFDPRLIEEINWTKKKALARLKAVLTGEQYAIFVEKSYEEKLGLRTFRAGRTE
jgi:hypothetical protein